MRGNIAHDRHGHGHGLVVDGHTFIPLVQISYLTIVKLFLCVLIILLSVSMIGGLLWGRQSKFLLRRAASHQRYLTTNIYIVGKRSVEEEWIGRGCSEYEKRLTPYLKLSTTFLKSDEELLKAVKQSRGKAVALDEIGRTMSSTEFSEFIFRGYEQGGSHVDFFIGGCNGLPSEIRSQVPLISLSKMTWPHQMARLLLVEQIYRAFEIRRGTGYHR